jgi:hypothetical protein
LGILVVMPFAFLLTVPFFFISPVAGLIGMLGMFALLMVVMGAIGGVFVAALYQFATTGEAPAPYTEEELRRAFRTRPRRRPWRRRRPDGGQQQS